MSQYETEVTEGLSPLGGVSGALVQYFSGTSYMNTLVNGLECPSLCRMRASIQVFVTTGISIMAGSRSS